MVDWLVQSLDLLSSVADITFMISFKWSLMISYVCVKGNKAGNINKHVLTQQLETLTEDSGAESKSE